jgi:hypothetical protein
MPISRSNNLVSRLSAVGCRPEFADSREQTADSHPMRGGGNRHDRYDRQA